jgi:hypothetical protein
MDLEINSHPIITKCIQKMLIDTQYNLPYYGTFNLSINFKEATKQQVPTCGVNVTDKGMNFYYNPGFLESLNSLKEGETESNKEKLNREKEQQKQVNFIVIHEDFHLLFNHPQRTVAGRFNPYLANIVQDMIINSIIWEDIDHNVVSIPKYPNTPENIKNDSAGKNMALFLPIEFIEEGGTPIFEELYTWMRKKKDEYDEKKKNMMKNSKLPNDCKTCNGTGKKPSDDSDGGSNGTDGSGDKNKEQNQGNGQGEGESKQNKEKSDQQGKSNQDGDGQGEGESNQEGDGKGKSDQQSQNNGQGGSGESDDRCPDCNGSGTNGTNLDGTPEYGPYSKAGDNVVDSYSLESIFENMDNKKGQYMDVHIEDTVPEELRESIISEVTERLKTRGLVQGNIEETINKLRRKRKDHLKYIKRAISNDIMGTNKDRSITRPHRRQIKGLKGFKKYGTNINVILDTSGSMYGLFEKVLEYVFQHNIQINMVQVDTEVHDVIEIKSMKEMQTMNVKGLGGTILQPGIELLTNNPKYSKCNTVILTDGYCDTLDMSKMKGRVLGITCGTNIPISSKPRKGYKEILVEKNE